MAKSKTINVQGTEINIIQKENFDRYGKRIWR